MYGCEFVDNDWFFYDFLVGHDIPVFVFVGVPTYPCVVLLGTGSWRRDPPATEVLKLLVLCSIYNVSLSICKGYSVKIGDFFSKS